MLVAILGLILGCYACHVILYVYNMFINKLYIRLIYIYICYIIYIYILYNIYITISHNQFQRDYAYIYISYIYI